MLEHISKCLVVPAAKFELTRINILFKCRYFDDLKSILYHVVLRPMSENVHDSDISINLEKSPN
jgi:hypothetical protein